MINKMSIITLVLATLVMFSGCAAKSENTEQQVVQNGQTGQGTQMAPPEGGRQGMFEPADLSGEITSISASEITVKVIKTSAFAPNGQGNNRGIKGSVGDKQQTDNPQDNGNSQDNTTQNDGKQPGTNTKRNGGGMRPGGAVEYTGEIKTIIIPSDILITTSVRGNNGMETKDVKLTDLQKGDILQVSYSDQDKESIEKVTVRSMIPNGANAQDSATTK